MFQSITTAKDGEARAQTLEAVKTARADFITAMDDDFNTADGISVLFELVRKINSALASPDVTKGDIAAYYDEFTALTNVLGLLYNKENDDIPAEVADLVEQRRAARKAKDFALADALRDKITALGYTVEETRQGTIVKKA